MKQEDNLEQFRVSLTKFEMKMTNALTTLKKQMFVEPISSRRKIESLREEYLLNENTILMFKRLDLLSEYTNLLKSYNKVLDGDLS